MNKYSGVYVILLTFFLLIVSGGYAQKKTYFQQEVNYQIDVRLDDETHILHGDINFEYTNNSPDELNFIYFHLWPNAYKNNHTALAKQKASISSNPRDLTLPHNQGYIDSLAFSVNGTPVKWEYHPEHIDICKVLLNDPLKSGETITIATPFRVKIPSASISRFGHIGQVYNCTQWYPKPAVYDHKGWHEMPYLNMGEFYSEYGTFDVRITLPENYVVAATGNLQTPSEIEWLEEKANEKDYITEEKNTNQSSIPSSDNYKTIRYTEENVHDFAWFADKHYKVLKDTVKLPNTGKIVNCWAFFNPSDYKWWKKAPGYIKDALYYYSKWYGDYEYDNCTAILSPPGARGGGMEYPGITAIGATKIDLLLEIVIMHEVGHNWFYGMLGFNEREHPWMDEGINTFSEIRYMMEKYGDQNMVSLALNDFAAKALGVKDLKYNTFHKYQYLNVARTNQDQPANLHSVEFKPINYSSVVYSKTGHAFYMLLHYLGEEKFDSIMQEFIDEWKFRHPYPEDLEKAFRKNTDENLDWFFQTMLRTNQKTDYTIKRFKNNKLLIKNKQDGATPFSIAGEKDGKVIFRSWNEGFEDEKWLDVPETNVDRFYIDPQDVTLDINERNNEIKPKGLFPKVNPLSLHLIGPIAQTDYTQINVAPALGYNYYNGFMSGIYLHSSFLPERKFNYNLIPLYGFNNKDFAGTGDISYTMYPEKSIFKNIELKLAGRIFGYSSNQGYNYDKLKFSTSFNLREQGATNNIYNSFSVSSIYASDVCDLMTLKESPQRKLFINLGHYYRNYEGRNSFRNKINLQGSDDFIKATIESNIYLKLKEFSKKSINIRLFGGAFLKEDNILSPYYLQMAGSSGIHDYTFENSYFGRFEMPANASKSQLLSQQFVREQGGFAIYTPFGQTNDWLVSLNVLAPIPFLSDMLPLKIYGNLATFGNMLTIPGYESENYGWEAGLKLTFTDALEIYFPLMVSDYIMDYSNDITDNYWQKIRFTFDLREIVIGF